MHALEIFRNIPAFYPKSRKAWRTWLTKNHAREKSVWVILFNKGSASKTISYDEAVEEALCFGWIDSVAYKRDAESRYQYFSVRKPRSNWSEINRARVEKMIDAGLMTESGQKVIDAAKASGRWLALAEVQNQMIPDDLQKQFAKSKTAYRNFMAFPPSSKRIILEWILNAKMPETRKKRIEETVRLAKENIRANHKK